MRSPVNGVCAPVVIDVLCPSGHRCSVSNSLRPVEICMVIITMCNAPLGMCGHSYLYTIYSTPAVQETSIITDEILCITTYLHR
jgi:hypothetical protein